MEKNINCKVTKYCGGCQLSQLKYEEQLELKHESLKRLLGKFNKVNTVLGMETPFRYRNKVQVTFDKMNGKVVYGNYVPSTHAIVPIKDCAICDEKSMQIISYIKTLAIKYHVSIFDEYTYKGCLRHVMVRSTNTGEYMVVFVTGTPALYKKEEIVKELIKKFPEIKTVVQNINNKHTSMVLGDRTMVLFGNGYITEELLGLKFRLSTSAFFQVNKVQTAKLYQTAIDFAGLTGKETVIDAYCGTGTIGLCMANKAKKVIGVELNEKAIKDAVFNMKNNKVKNAEFIADDAGRFMNKLARDRVNVDTVVMDPPRAGSDTKFMNALLTLKPRKIVYVSCNPVTLKSNLDYLTKKMYKVSKIQPVDMFPFSEHIETVVLLTKI